MGQFKFLNKNKTSQLPKSPGVYCFKKEREFLNAEHSRFLTKSRFLFPSEARNQGSVRSRFLYIGKASNIRYRVRNHFQQPAYKDNFFIDKAQKIGYIKTDSEIEALILEAKLIKKYQPKYNVLWRDDKNYFYTGITIEDFPRIFLTHQIKSKYQKIKSIFIGPFVEGSAIKKTLRVLRKIFPYYIIKKHPKGACPWCHLGLCPGPDPDAKEYNKNIKNLISVLRGRKKSILKILKKEMKSASSSQDFEKAAKIRDQIEALERVLSHTKIINNRSLIPEEPPKEWLMIQKTLQNLTKTKGKISRIEAYDVSNTQGKLATGSMVTFLNGMPEKNFYRKFKIKIGGKPNDVAMLKEILWRRFQHQEWLYPGLILIDGGRAQLNGAIESKSRIQKAKKIKIIALAKKENKLFIEKQKNPFLLRDLPREIFNLILHLRDEAHRFAISYHRKLRRKALVEI